MRNGRTNTKTVIGMHTFHFVFLNCLLHLLDCNFWTGIRLRYNWYLSYENVVQVNLARTWCWWWTPCRTQSLTEAGYTRRVFVFFLTWMLHTVTLSGVLWRHQAFRSMTLQTIRGTWWKPKRNIIWMFFFTDWTITLIDIVGLQWVTFLSLRRWEVQLFRLKVLLFVSSIFSLRENFRYILSVFCWPVSWKRLKLLSSFCRHILVLVIRATLCPTMNSQYLFLQTKTYLDMDSWYHILLICDLVLFQAKCLEIEDFRWYKSLVLFGCGNDPYDIDVDDPDVKLIPIVLEKSLIPKLTGIKFLFHWFLPMSVSLKAAWSWLFQFILPCERKYLYIEGFLKNGSFVR